MFRLVQPTIWAKTILGRIISNSGDEYWQASGLKKS